MRRYGQIGWRMAAGSGPLSARPALAVELTGAPTRKRHLALVPISPAGCASTSGLEGVGLGFSGGRRGPRQARPARPGGALPGPGKRTYTLGVHQRLEPRLQPVRLSRRVSAYRDSPVAGRPDRRRGDPRHPRSGRKPVMARARGDGAFRALRVTAAAAAAARMRWRVTAAEPPEFTLAAAGPAFVSCPRHIPVVARSGGPRCR